MYTTTGSWQTTKNTHIHIHIYIYIYIYIYKILYFYSSMVTLAWSRRAVRESLHTQRSCWEKLNFSQNSRPYIILKLPCDPHGHASSHMQCLLSINHGLNPQIFFCQGYYAHALLVFHWSRLTPTHFFMPQLFFW